MRGNGTINWLVCLPLVCSKSSSGFELDPQITNVYCCIVTRASLACLGIVCSSSTSDFDHSMDNKDRRVQLPRRRPVVQVRFGDNLTCDPNYPPELSKRPIPPPGLMNREIDARKFRDISWCNWEYERKPCAVVPPRRRRNPPGAEAEAEAESTPSLPQRYPVCLDAPPVAFETEEGESGFLAIQNGQLATVTSVRSLMPKTPLPEDSYRNLWGFRQQVLAPPHHINQHEEKPVQSLDNSDVAPQKDVLTQRVIPQMRRFSLGRERSTLYGYPRRHLMPPLPAGTTRRNPFFRY